MCRRISSLPTFVSVCERVEMTNNCVGWFMHIAKTTLTHPLFLSLSLSLSLPRRTDALFEKVLCCTTPCHSHTRAALDTCRASRCRSSIPTNVARRVECGRKSSWTASTAPGFLIGLKLHALDQLLCSNWLHKRRHHWQALHLLTYTLSSVALNAGYGRPSVLNVDTVLGGQIECKQW